MALPLQAVGTAYGLDGREIKSERPHLDAGTRWIWAAAGELDDRAKKLGYPVTGAGFFMIGGGATLAKGDICTQVTAFTGSLSARQGNRLSAWDLNLGSLNVEQVYDYGSFAMTAGATTDYGYLNGRLDDAPKSSYLQVPLYGGGVSLGFRVPAGSTVALFVRSAYQWMQGDGEWKGELGPQLGGQHVDLSGPSLTTQLEISF